MEPFAPKHLSFQTSEAKRQAGLQCCAYGCKNKPCSKKKGMCHTHYARHLRIKDPVYDRFKNFRGNALRRGKPFEITLQEFRDWCAGNGYCLQKGKRGRNCTIDRIRNWEGYNIHNIQIKSNEANVRKYHDHDKHFTELPPEDEDYLPF